MDKLAVIMWSVVAILAFYWLGLIIGAVYVSISYTVFLVLNSIYMTFIYKEVKK